MGYPENCETVFSFVNKDMGTLNWSPDFNILNDALFKLHNEYLKNGYKSRDPLYTIQFLLGGGDKPWSKETLLKLEYSYQNLLSRLADAIKHYTK